MALTTDRSETVQDRIRRDPGIRKYVLIGCVEHLILGEVEVARSRLRGYVTGVVGFEGLGAMIGESPQRLEQRLGAEGELQAGKPVRDSRPAGAARRRASRDGCLP